MLYLFRKAQEGAIGRLPDLTKWAQTIKHLLKDDGFFYIFENHPIYLMFDEGKLAAGETTIKYPYFKTKPDVDETIGGYASESKGGVETYFWQYKISAVVKKLTTVCIIIRLIPVCFQCHSA